MSQRPHFFIQHVLHAGIKEVFWINPYPGRLPGFQDFIPGRHAHEPASKLELTNLTVISLKPVFPIEPFHQAFKFVNHKSLKDIINKISDFKDDETLLIIGKPSLLGIELIKLFHWKSVLFDAMDNYPAFFSGYSSSSMSKIEERIAQAADFIVCSSHPLAIKFSRFKTKVQLCLNACTSDFIMRRERISTLAAQSYTLGYVGTIAAWFDWQWLINLATLYPQNKFRIVGPIKTLKPGNLPLNIILEKAISHDQVPAFLREIDIGLIPFRDNAITHYVDPIKFYEYQAAGLPVLSSEFGEMKWHLGEKEKLNEQCPFSLPSNALYFGSNHIQPITWDMRFAELFKTMLIK